VGKTLLAHAASEQGIVAAENAMGGNSVMDYRTIPNCIYTFPEVASVGISEEQAKEEGWEVKIGRFPFLANGKAQSLGETEGFVKVIADGRTYEILGVHIIGPEATDLIPEATLAVKHRMNVKQIAETIHAHPTLSEAFWEAVKDVSKVAIHIQ